MRNQENVHFLDASNQGAALAEGELSFVSQQRYTVLPGAIAAALETLDRRSRQRRCRRKTDSSGRAPPRGGFDDLEGRYLLSDMAGVTIQIAPHTSFAARSIIARRRFS